VYSRTSGLALLVLALLLAIAGCGGGSSDQEATATVAVRGPGFVFRAPADRELVRTERAVMVQPPGEGGAELESVTRYPLIKAFRPTLWPGVVTELDGAVDKLAAGLSGTVESDENVRAGGRRARRYEVSYEREGEQLRQRITFVFRGREEFQLLCRYPDAETPPPACTLMEQTFTLA
jgi:hypothetical protein